MGFEVLKGYPGLSEALEGAMRPEMEFLNGNFSQVFFLGSTLIFPFYIMFFSNRLEFALWIFCKDF